MSFYLPQYPMMDSDIIRRQLAYSGVDVQPYTSIGRDTSSAAATNNSNPDLGSTGVMAGAGLLGGLMKQAADREQLKNKLEYSAEDKKYENLSKSAAALSKGQQDALMRLINNLRGATL